MCRGRKCVPGTVPTTLSTSADTAVRSPSSSVSAPLIFATPVTKTFATSPKCQSTPYPNALLVRLVSLTRFHTYRFENIKSILFYRTSRSSIGCGWLSFASGSSSNWRGVRPRLRDVSKRPHLLIAARQTLHVVPVVIFFDTIFARNILPLTVQCYQQTNLFRFFLVSVFPHSSVSVCLF